MTPVRGTSVAGRNSHIRRRIAFAISTVLVSSLLQATATATAEVSTLAKPLYQSALCLGTG